MYGLPLIFWDLAMDGLLPYADSDAFISISAEFFLEGMDSFKARKIYFGVHSVTIHLVETFFRRNLIRFHPDSSTKMRFVRIASKHH